MLNLTCGPRHRNVHFVDNSGNELFGGDALSNPTVDGTHPTDIGDREMVNFYAKFLPPLLSS